MPKKPKLPANFVSPFPINEARLRTTMDFYTTHNKKFKAPVLTTKARNQFLGDDNRIDGIFTATNPNFEAGLCEDAKLKLRLDKRSNSLLRDLG